MENNVSTIVYNERNLRRRSFENIADARDLEMTQGQVDDILKSLTELSVELKGLAADVKAIESLVPRIETIEHRVEVMAKAVWPHIETTNGEGL